MQDFKVKGVCRVELWIFLNLDQGRGFGMESPSGVQAQSPVWSVAEKLKQFVNLIVTSSLSARNGLDFEVLLAFVLWAPGWLTIDRQKER